MHYLTKKQIADALERYKAGDNEAICDVAVILGTKYYQYLRSRGLNVDQDEIIQESVVKILTEAGTINLDGNPFAYLTTMIAGAITKAWRRDTQDFRRAAKYAYDRRYELGQV